MGQVWRAVEPGEDGASREARLVDGLRCGAPGAFAGLHEEYAAGIYTLALRMVRHAPDAEDITQDVLIRAYERVPRDREVLLRPWLYRLTLNCCYDHLRAAARRRAPSGDGHGAEVELASPVDLFEQSELQRLFEAALGDLTRRQRAALLLKDVHGLSLVEVGACLELTTGSVEVLLARARKAFRVSFEGRCPAEGRPAPSSAGLLAGLPALPLYPLPPALLAPPALPTVLPLPVSLPPIAGGGIGLGAALGLPASLKTAALILAAAATVGTAEVAVTRSEAPPVKRPVAVVPVAGAISAAKHARAAAPGRRPSAAARGASSPTPSPTASALVADEPSPPTTVGDDPTASPPPLGISSPAPTPDATLSPSPTAHATASPTPTPVPSPTATSPAPSQSPAP